MYTILLVAHTIIVLFLIMLVLIQRSSSDGLSGLGGGGGNQFLTGRASANLLTRTTAILAGAFMCTSLILAVMASRMTEGSIIDATPVEQSAPMEKAAPAAPVKKATPAVPKPE
jgi:preprotein translocase subunit SecG